MQKYKLFKDLASAIESDDENLFKKALSVLNTAPLGSSDKQLLAKLTQRAQRKFHLNDSPTLAGAILSGDTFHVTSNQALETGVAFVTACMNRNDNLAKALKSWLATSVDEIIIVDWSSSTPVEESIAEFLSDPRITIVRVNNEPNWILTYAFNVGLQCVSKETVFKLDADIVLSADFVEANPVPENHFVRGSWQQALETGDNSQVFINGSFGCRTTDLRKVGYYNEFIRTYGWDDSDLYQRLTIQGVSQAYLKSETLLHIEQADDTRMANQDVSQFDLLGKFSATDFQNTRNKYIAATWDQWWPENRQNYTIQQDHGSVYSLERATEHKYIPEWVIEHAETLALSGYLRTTEWRLAANYYQPVTCKFLLNEYRAGIAFKTSAKLLLTEKEATINGDLESAFDGSLLVAVGERRASKVLVTDTLDQIVEVLTAEDLNLLNQARISSGRQPIKSVTLEASELADPQKPRLYIEVQHGLGNRLRALASAASIASNEGYELILVWIPDNHCDCKIGDLFDYKLPALSSKPFYNLKQRPFTQITYMELEEGHIKDEPLSFEAGSDTVIRSAYTLNHPSSDWTTDNAFLQSLKPEKGVQEILDRVYFKGGIGCHIRMQGGSGQSLASYDASENWSDESHKAITEWRDKSHYSRFLEKIAQMPEHDNLGIFCAADLSSTYDKMGAKLGKRMRAFKRESDATREADDLKYALADAIMLSRSKILLGSGWSSFTELALRLSTTIETKLTAGEDF